MRVTITFNENGLIPVDIRRLQPAVIKGKSASEIERIEVSFGNRSCLVGDLAVVKISQEDENRLILDGHTRQLVNAGFQMDGGILVIEGDAGNSVGMGMQDGLIHVRGSVGDRCGANQPGQAHDMCGGTILVEKDSGSETGAGMRRGLIFIAGDAGGYAGSRMLAGSIIIAGKAGHGAGLGMKRGSMVIGQLERVLPGFRNTGQPDDEWLRIYSTFLKSEGIILPYDWLGDGLTRFTGDNLDLGKGELLVHDLIE